MFGRCRIGVRGAGAGWLVHYGGFHVCYAPDGSRDEIGQRCMVVSRTCRGSPAQRGCNGSIPVLRPEDPAHPEPGRQAQARPGVLSLAEVDYFH